MTQFVSICIQTIRLGNSTSAILICIFKTFQQSDRFLWSVSILQRRINSVDVFSNVINIQHL